MALTNCEKDHLRIEIKYYLRHGFSKGEAKDALIKEGFKSSTIDRYWSVFKKMGVWWGSDVQS